MSFDHDNEEKKKIVSDRLSKREQERLENLKNKRTEKLDKIVLEETYETFKPKFTEIKNDIDEEIWKLDGLSKDDKPAKIESLINKVQNLQILLSEATKYLTTYHIEKFSEDITSLRNTLDSKQIHEQKQKKFNFKQSKKKTSDEQVKINESNPINKTSTVSKVLSKFDSDRTILISNQSNVTQVYNSDINKMEIVISNLTNCTIYLRGSPSTVHIDDLVRSKVFIGPVSGSVFVNNATDSKLHVACHQLRIHKTIATDFYIHVTTRAIVEDCKNVNFGRYKWTYDGIEADFEVSKLNKGVNNWDKIDDFNWLVADVPSPNWSIINED